VRISDRGCGFDPGAHSEGFGLVGMRERVALAGGRLELRSEAGEGTTIEATIPTRLRGTDSVAA
jgi:two-component system sensor histidine kinase UhpB